MPTPKEIFTELKAKVLAAVTVILGVSTLVHGLKDQVAAQAAENESLHAQLNEALAKLAETENVDVTELQGLVDRVGEASVALNELSQEIGASADELATAVVTVPA